MKSKLNISDVGKPGVVISDVIEAELEHDGHKHAVVVKRVHKKTVGRHFSYSDTALQDAAQKNHVLDRKILERLQDHPTVLVPRVLMDYTKKHQTVMSDFTAEGYALMQDRLIETTLPAITAVNAAKTLAHLQQALRDKKLMQGIKPVEDSTTQARERLAEAHFLLYGNLDNYRELEAKFLSEDGLLYPVARPGNMAVNGSGEVMVYDFGRVITGSQQFVPASFLAHIGLAWIGGVMAPEKAKAFICDFYDTFNDVIPIEEEWFVKFFAAELVHRGLAMRWIDPRMFKEVRKVSAKLAVHAVFLDVYEYKCNSLAGLIESVDNHASKLL